MKIAARGNIMPDRQYNIPPHRRGLYYVGMTIAILGALSFGSVFVSAAMNFGDFTEFHRRGQSMAMRAIGGMGAIIVGAVLMNMGARGAAGSGIILDPKRARKDVEPWARMGGGMINDALSEVDALKALKRPDGEATGGAQVVRIRCRQCSALNDEQAKFCNQCGRPV
jgi:hypothetical protein